MNELTEEEFKELVTIALIEILEDMESEEAYNYWMGQVGVKLS